MLVLPHATSLQRSSIAIDTAATGAVNDGPRCQIDLLKAIVQLGNAQNHCLV